MVCSQLVMKGERAQTVTMRPVSFSCPVRMLQHGQLMTCWLGAEEYKTLLERMKGGKALIMGQLLPQRRGQRCRVSPNGQARLITERKLGSTTSFSCTVQDHPLLLIYYQCYLFMSSSMTCSRLRHRSVHGGCLCSLLSSVQRRSCSFTS